MNKRKFLKYCTLCSAAGLVDVGFNPSLAAITGRSFVPFIPEFPDEKLWKWSKEAACYVQTPRGLKCQVCPTACIVKPGELSACHTRLIHNDKLYTIAYGNPCSVHVDPIEKKPLFHFLPSTKSYSIATAGCNLACLNCQNWEISQVSPRETSNKDMMPEKVVSNCIENKCPSISYTYSEPVAYYEYCYETAKIAQLKGIKNVLVSAGYINEVPLRNLAKYIDAANINLKSFSNEIYEMLNGGTLDPVLRTLKVLKEEGVWLEITNLVVPTWTDDMDMIKKMCDWLVQNGFRETPLHFNRFFPLYKLKNLSPTPASVLEKARDIAHRAGISYVYIGNIPGSTGENTYCPKCKKLIIERKGFTILQNDLISGGCKYCKHPVPGKWK